MIIHEKNIKENCNKMNVRRMIYKETNHKLKIFIKKGASKSKWQIELN